MAAGYTEGRLAGEATAGLQEASAMSDRPRFFDDLAGVAGGALSALAGLREEAEALVRARIDEAIRKLELVRKEELDAMADMAANARAGQEAAEARLAALEARVAALEAAQTSAAQSGPSHEAGQPEGA
jgi:BMFP domain-containing protein YqiC